MLAVDWQVVLAWHFSFVLADWLALADLPFVDQ
jgi:hypothetical protein